MSSATLHTDKLSIFEAPFWYYGTGTLRQHGGIVVKLDAAPDPQQVADRVAGTLDWCTRLTSRIEDPGGQFSTPYYAPDTNFDLDNHFRHISAPGDGTLDSFNRYFSGTFHQPFDPARPQWDATYIDGVDGGSILALRAHHCMIDALCGIEWLRAMSDQSMSFDEARQKMRQSPARARAERSKPEDLGGSEGKANTSDSTWKAILRPNDPLWPQPIGPDRFTALASLPLADIKEIRGATKTSTAAVFQTLMSYALEQLIVDLPDEVTVSMPLSVRHLFQQVHPLDLSSRQISSPLNLPLSAKPPLARLAAIQERVVSVRLHRKQLLHTAKLARKAPRKLILAATKHKMSRSNFISSICTGPRDQFSIAGANLTGIGLYTGLVPFNPLAIGAITIGDELAMGITADPTVIPQAIDLPKMLSEALDRLLVATR